MSLRLHKAPVSARPRQPLPQLGHAYQKLVRVRLPFVFNEKRITLELDLPEDLTSEAAVAFT